LPDSKQTAAATQGKRMKLLFLMQIARQQTNGSCSAGQTYEAAVCLLLMLTRKMLSKNAAPPFATSAAS